MHLANPNIELLEPYKGRTKRIKMRCKIHNVISTKTPYEVIHGKGCVMCGYEKLSLQNKTPQNIFIQELYEKYEDIKLIDGYTAKTEYAKFHCNQCGSDWTDMAWYVIQRGCPVCNATSMEFKISKILQQFKIDYIPQYSFDNCRDQRKLPFDFYLLNYNILIEYDGEQHYKPVNFGGISDEKAIENFKIIQYHDKIKTEYCVKNNIPLIRIPYWEKDNLENVLKTKLQQYVSI